MIESNSLEVTNSLRMSGGVMLHMTGNQSVCVGFSAPDIVRMAQFNRVSTSDSEQSFSRLQHSILQLSTTGPVLLSEESLH